MNRFWHKLLNFFFSEPKTHTAMDAETNPYRIADKPMSEELPKPKQENALISILTFLIKLVLLPLLIVWRFKRIILCVLFFIAVLLIPVPIFWLYFGLDGVATAWLTTGINFVYLVAYVATKGIVIPEITEKGTVWTYFLKGEIVRDDAGKIVW